ncbi:Cellulose synthase (UDP-forming) [Handroanthus impetiginosus]|uniref:Cellulose synthase (UDP-forming) n=1 Tax=Handroanthus impetiginosus TaxID=429701 RepID=A0A2G9G3Y8_9LAMI|nr:Cellulose synthase (UDP-forming) [Handroanthus impetiginosus]
MKDDKGIMGANKEDEPLFETKIARGGAAHKLFSFTIIIGLVLIWTYRLILIPTTSRRHSWFNGILFFADVLLGFYWIITQSGRCRVVYRYPFKDRLITRYKEKLPKVDIFVCTADPILEPPSMVMSTVLSVMSYNYPTEKISVYLSDDGGSELTFYALLEASKFSKSWIPFTKKYNVEPRSPEVYFSHQNTHMDNESSFAHDWTNVKELYEDMKSRIDSVEAKGCIPGEIVDQHKGFSEWNSKVTKHDHQSIVQILAHNSDPKAVDIEGNRLPTLVYLSREKKPGWPHNFKAGAMNALLRVSEKISNAPIILNVDCDMYANDPDVIQDALCFFLDEKKGQQISYVQYPQQYNNLVKNDIYANVNLPINEVCVPIIYLTMPSLSYI